MTSRTHRLALLIFVGVLVLAAVGWVGLVNGRRDARDDGSMPSGKKVSGSSVTNAGHSKGHESVIARESAARGLATASPGLHEVLALRADAFADLIATAERCGVLDRDSYEELWMELDLIDALDARDPLLALHLENLERWQGALDEALERAGCGHTPSPAETN